MRYRIALACALAVLPFAGADADDSACNTKALGTASVRAALNGRTLALADGRTLRLAGVELWPAAEAQAALRTMVAGRELLLAQLGEASDRYGRVVALVVPAGAAAPLQITLLAQGFARISARGANDAGCLAAFRRAEQSAREKGLGLWADPSYLTQDAERPDEILKQRGRLALVEGNVLSVRERFGTIYVNFGHRWSQDFTATAAKRNERRFVNAGLPLKNLAGQRVRVRGTVEERGGPWIELVAPEQIEIAGR